MAKSILRFNPGLEIWAVLNLTPDSFYEGSRVGAAQFTEHALALLQQGADKLDIGAESSRPFAEQVDHQEEWARLKQPLADLKKELGEEQFGRVVSLDSYKPETVKKALEMGIRTINDISGAASGEMIEAVAGAQADYVLMHSQGTPATMQKNPHYENVSDEVWGYLEQKSRILEEAGLDPARIIWDYGIGFGKTVEHNMTLLRDTSRFTARKPCRFLAGISRKSFIGKVLQVEDPAQRLNGTQNLHVYLALQGVDILRVHDVKEAAQMRTLLRALNNISPL